MNSNSMPNSFNPFNQMGMAPGFFQGMGGMNEMNSLGNMNMYESGSLYSNTFNNGYYDYYESLSKENNKFSNNKFNNNVGINSNYEGNKNYNHNQQNHSTHNHSQNNVSSNTNNDDDPKSGKYTCRFELLIDNDKDFQVARKLIGSKGCNMKRIVESCAGNEPSEVKLRLRGKGSGFREGPNQQESDEPLHLCVSSKYVEKYQQACQLVQELINSVYDEYKKYCQKTKQTPLPSIYKVIEEGISTRKVHYGRESNSFHKHY